MKATFLFALVCGSACAVEVTPVQKVLQLMEGMLAKGKKMKHDEQVQFAAYKQFCEDTTVEKNRLIDEAAERITVLKADIAKQTAFAAKMTQKIKQLDEDISIWNGDIKAATKVRRTEKADYDATHKDYSESISALERAIAVLKKQDYDRKQASLIQVKELTSLSLIPADAKIAIDKFIQQDSEADADEGLALSAPEANAYDFQSSGIIEMLD